MTTWTRRVAAALRSSKVRNGIAQVAVEWMERHINENRGQPRKGAIGASGSGIDGITHAPLKPIYGQRWVTSKPAGGFTKTRTVTYQTPKGKTRKRTEYLIETPSYRNGGQPLRNTGALTNSLNARGMVRGSGMRLVLRGNKYGLYQDMGFVTSGPNYIPLTKRGARYDSSERASASGMISGKDYTGSRKGVTVPARPFLLPTSKDKHAIGISIKLGLQSILKGK